MVSYFMYMNRNTSDSWNHALLKISFCIGRGIPNIGVCGGMAPDDSGAPGLLSIHHVVSPAQRGALGSGYMHAPSQRLTFSAAVLPEFCRLNVNVHSLAPC